MSDAAARVIARRRFCFPGLCDFQTTNTHLTNEPEGASTRFEPDASAFRLISLTRNSSLEDALSSFAGSGHAADEAAGAEVFESLGDGLAFVAVKTLAAEGGEPELDGDDREQ